MLSGYLITSLLLVEGNRTGRVRLGRFWARRARRLLPALALLLIAVAAYARWVADPGELHRIRWDGLATVAYVANWRQIFGQVDYFALFSAPSPLDHTWSLAIEEQFYLLWPLIFLALVALAKRRGANLSGAVCVLAVALGAVSVGLQVVFGSMFGWERVYFGTDTRAFAILVGAAVAGVMAWRGPVVPGRPRAALEVAGAVGVVVLAAGWALLEGTGSAIRHGGLVACSIAGGLVVASVAYPKCLVLGKAFAWAPLRWLGLISDGVYLYHWPIDVWLSPERSGLSGWNLVGVHIIVTLAVSVLSYRVIEQPIRHGRFVTGRFAVTTVPVAGALTVVALLIVATSTSVFDRSGFGDDVAVGPGKGETTLIVGDSVGWYLATDGFSKVRPSPPMRFVNESIPRCVFPATDSFRLVDGTMTDRFTSPCNQGWPDLVRETGANRVLLVLGASTADALHHDGAYVAACSPAFQTWYLAELQAVLGAITRAGAHTFVVTMPAALNAGNRTEQTQEANERAATCTNRARRGLSNPQGPLQIDLDAKICPVGPTSCIRTWDGEDLRPDTVHFRGASAPLVAGWILDEMHIRNTVKSGR